jgi:hypothetical protein
MSKPGSASVSAKAWADCTATISFSGGNAAADCAAHNIKPMNGSQTLDNLAMPFLLAKVTINLDRKAKSAPGNIFAVKTENNGLVSQVLLVHFNLIGAYQPPFLQYPIHWTVCWSAGGLPNRNARLPIPALLTRVMCVGTSLS